MAITGEERHELHTHFEKSMGPRMAANLMDLLPPVGWGDVATKQDIASLHDRFGHIDERFAHEREITNEQFKHTWAVMDERFKHTWAVMATTTDVAEVRTDVAEVRTDVAEARTDVEKVRTHVEVVRTEFHRALRLHLLALAMLVLTLANILR